MGHHVSHGQLSIMMNRVLSESPIQQLSILKWKWYIEDQSQIGPESIRKHRNRLPTSTVAPVPLPQLISMASWWVSPWSTDARGKSLVLFLGWVSSVCWSKLKMDCCCIRALLSRGDSGEWKSSQWTLLSGHHFMWREKQPQVRLQSDSGPRVNGLAGWSEACKKQNWKIKDKEICRRGMWIDLWERHRPRGSYASTAEDALNHQVKRKSGSEDVSQCLSSTIPVLAHE